MLSQTAHVRLPNGKSVMDLTDSDQSMAIYDCLRETGMIFLRDDITDNFLHYLDFLVSEIWGRCVDGHMRDVVGIKDFDAKDLFQTNMRSISTSTIHSIGRTVLMDHDVHNKIFSDFGYKYLRRIPERHLSPEMLKEIEHLRDLETAGIL